MRRGPFGLIEIGFAFPWAWRPSVAHRWRSYWLLIYLVCVEIRGQVIPLFPCAVWARVEKCD